MRYRKGSISLNRTRDYPLLRQVLDSSFITHGQLFDLMKLDYCTSSRNEFNNRVLRLVNHGLLVRSEQSVGTHELIYAISEAGALQLAGIGDYCTQTSCRPRSKTIPLRIHHSLELNEIHLALKRGGSLIRWTPEAAVRSRNNLTSAGYEKYYDAVVVVRLDRRDCMFALEYERTPKAARHYEHIRDRIERESHVGHFLYLMPNHDLLKFVADQFQQCPRTIYFGLLRDFLEQKLSLSVTQNRTPVSMPLAIALLGGNEPRGTRPLFSEIAV